MTVSKYDYPESINDSVPREETERLIASDKVEGTPVFGSDGEQMGHVHNLMVDKYAGTVVYAVMSFGGFLGVGERYHPLPWPVLRYDPKLGGYVVGIKKEALQRGPSFAKGEDPVFDGAGMISPYGYYGMTV